MADVNSVVKERDSATVERYFRTVLNATPDGFMVFEAVREGGEIVDFRWVYTNPAAERIVGRTHEDLLGKRLLVGDAGEPCRRSL